MLIRVCYTLAISPYGMERSEVPINPPGSTTITPSCASEEAPTIELSRIAGKNPQYQANGTVLGQLGHPKVGYEQTTVPRPVSEGRKLH